MQHNLPPRTHHKPKLLIIGHARHGKDTVADEFARQLHLSKLSSSEAAFEMIRDELEQELSEEGWTPDSPDVEGELYVTKFTHRKLWKELIERHTRRKASALVDIILAKSDIYVGMRSLYEFDRTHHIFDAVIYVDASPRVPADDPSMEIPRDHSGITIHLPNHSSEDTLPSRVTQCLYHLRLRGIAV